MYIQKNIHIFICTYIHIYKYTYIHINMYIYIYKYTYTCVYLYINIYIYIHVCIYIYIYIHMYTYIHTCMCIYMYTDTFLCIYVFTYYTQRNTTQVFLSFSLLFSLYNIFLSLLRRSKTLLPRYFASMIVQARTHLGLEQKNAQHTKLYKTFTTQLATH